MNLSCVHTRLVLPNVHILFFSFQLSISNTCWMKRGNNHYNMLLDEGYKDIEAPSVKTCFYEGRVYDDGSSWIPVGNNSCYTCTCQVSFLKQRNTRN